MTLSIAKNTKSAIDIKKNGKSTSINFVFAFKVPATTAPIPRINRPFAILEPIMLSTTNCVSPALIAKSDDTSSGSEVPIATIVAPIMKSSAQI